MPPVNLESVATLSKSTLSFSIPSSSAALNHLPSDTLAVTNIHTTPVAFKIKTTNQARYLVRPTAGLVEPSQSLQVVISIQPTHIPPELSSSRDKFLIKLLPTTLSNVHLPPDFWTTATSQSIDYKLKVEFTSPDEQKSKEVLVEPDKLLNVDYDTAVEHVKQMQSVLEQKNLELTALRTELAETKAETQRVLKDAPTTPLSANKVLSDPFGGVSVAGLALMFLLFLVVVNILLRIF